MEFILEFHVEFVAKYLKTILRVIGVMKSFHSMVVLELIISQQSNGQFVRIFIHCKKSLSLIHNKMLCDDSFLFGGIRFSSNKNGFSRKSLFSKERNKTFWDLNSSI